MSEINVIGPYVILSKIASGGMGDVYLARRRETGQQVALKVVHAHLSNNPDFIARFLREANTLRTLRHPHIVEVFDAGSEGGRHFLAMEYIGGGSLQSRLDQLRSAGEGMPLDEAMLISRQVALALDYAHSKGFVHRDVKPSNILLRGDGSCVLTDFGIVLAQDQTRLTHTMQMLGTPAYMSPEQVRGQPLDRRTDIYALGAVLYEMLTGSPPYRATDTPAMLYAIVNETVRPVNKLRPGLPTGVTRLVEASLAKDPNRRFQTASQFVGALDATGNADGGRAPITPLPQPLPKLPSLPGKAIGAAVALAVLLIAAAVIITTLQSTQTNRQPGQATQVIARATATLVEAVVISTENATVNTLEPTPPEAVPTEASSVVLPAAQPTAELPTPAPLPTPTLDPVTFSDELSSGALRSDIWDGANGDSTQVLDGVLLLSSNTTAFPHVQSRANPFPAEGDFQLRFRFRYPRVETCGVSVGMASYRVPPNLDEAAVAALEAQSDQQGMSLKITQDNTHGLEIVFQLQGQRQALLISQFDQQWHDVVIDYARRGYALALDGRVVFVSPPTDARPSVIRIGNPAVLNWGCPWSSLEVTGITVQRIAGSTLGPLAQVLATSAPAQPAQSQPESQATEALATLPSAQPTATTRPAGCATGDVQITSPASGSVVNGQVLVQGTATCEGFVYYKFVFESGSCPAVRGCFVAGPRVPCSGEGCPALESFFTQPVINGGLMSWDTTKFPNGRYTLALIAVGGRGRELQQRARIVVTIRN